MCKFQLISKCSDVSLDAVDSVLVCLNNMQHWGTCWLSLAPPVFYHVSLWLAHHLPSILYLSVITSGEFFPPCFEVVTSPFGQRKASLWYEGGTRIYGINCGGDGSHCSVRGEVAHWKVHSPNLLKRKCISEVVRESIIFHLSKLWKHHVLHTVWCNISGEATGEIWDWSLLGMKGLTVVKLIA